MARDEFNINQPLIISFLIHICLWLIVLVLPSKTTLMAPQEVEVVYQNETKKKPDPNAKMIVDDANELKKELTNLNDKAKLLSKYAQRVHDEQVASRPDLVTANRNGLSPTNDDFSSTEKTNPGRQAEPKPEAPPQQDIPKETADDGAYQKPSITAPPSSNIGRNAQMGDSSIANVVPGVKEGGFTALNQDQFIYYTFYSRINEQIRNRWAENVSTFLTRAPQSEVNRLAARNQITEVEVLLTKNGDFVRAMVHRKSESSELDESVLSAFRLAAPFPNPPLEIVDHDGYIHLYYGFYVLFRPSFVAGSK